MAKVCNIWRLTEANCVKKTVVASTLDELRKKAIEKLKLEGRGIVRVVDQTSSDIEDEEVFNLLPTSTIYYFLLNDETLAVTAIDVPTDVAISESPMTQNEAVLEQPMVVLSNEEVNSLIQDPNVNVVEIDGSDVEGKENVDTGTCTPIDDELIQKVVSRYSVKVKVHLKNGTIHTAWNCFIEETAYSLVHLNVEMQNKTSYKTFGSIMVESYPCVGIVSKPGDKPYRYFTKTLSRKIRKVRAAIKPKAERKERKSENHEFKTPDLTGEHSEAEPWTTQKPTVINKSQKNVKTFELKGDHTGEHALKEELKPLHTKENSIDVARVKRIMSETFIARHDYIHAALATMGIPEILAMFPHLTVPEFIIEEFEHSFPTLSFVDFTNNYQNIMKVLYVMKHEEEPSKKLSLAEELDLWDYVERETKMGGPVTKSVIIRVQPSTVPTIQTDYTFPVILINGELDTSANALICVQNIKIDCSVTSLSKAIFLLMAMYYNLGLNYPKSYVGVLGFIQNRVCLDDSRFERSTKYPKFVVRFKKLDAMTG